MGRGPLTKWEHIQAGHEILGGREVLTGNERVEITVL